MMGTMKLFGYVDGLERSLNFHRSRNAVLAGNVANIDTPSYRPLDLKREVLPHNSSASLLPISRTQDSHLAASVLSEPYVVRSLEAKGTKGPDGNGVSLEQELAKLDANRVRYSTVSELVSRRLALLRYAASDGLG